MATGASPFSCQRRNCSAMIARRWPRRRYQGRLATPVTPATGSVAPLKRIRKGTAAWVVVISPSSKAQSVHSGRSRSQLWPAARSNAIAPLPPNLAISSVPRGVERTAEGGAPRAPARVGPARRPAGGAFPLPAGAGAPLLRVGGSGGGAGRGRGTGQQVGGGPPAGPALFPGQDTLCGGAH